ncbi:MAG: hypothetical protein R3C12_04040 [Planctomycetaceae bacterium]
MALVVFLLTGHGDSPVYASASQIVEAAIHTHAEPIERVYVVEVERNPSADNGLNLPRDVKVSTQGDRFWVEMNGYRRWAWGRDADGAIWMTLGPRRAVVVGADEMGVPLKYIGDLYTLHLETLLQDFLKICQLERAEGPAGTDIICRVHVDAGVSVHSNERRSKLSRNEGDPAARGQTGVSRSSPRPS